MPQLVWITSIPDGICRFSRLLVRSSRLKFVLTAAIAFLVVQIMSWIESTPRLEIGPGYAQTAQIINQAGAQFTDVAGNPFTARSNTVALQTAGSPELTIIKTADRGAAEPGDVVVYRLLVRNPSERPAGPITVVDELPLGMQLLEDSFRTTPFALTSLTTRGRSFTLEFGAAVLAPGQELSIVYAALVTPDAIRGSGRNVAQAATPGATSTATYDLAIRPGILADCGTLIGRVFVDKNFDGEQQPGEPGVPNAVVFLDDGNRILTDPDGLFSVANVLAGNRVGTLDLSILPGYTLAPNLYRIEGNSQSRLVRLEPGGLARMNFGVTPAFGEEQGA